MENSENLKNLEKNKKNEKNETTKQQNITETAESLYIKFAEKILSLAKSWAETEALLPKFYPYVLFSKNWYETRVREFVDYGLFIRKHCHENNYALCDLPEVISCLRKHIEDGLIIPFKTSDGTQSMTTSEAISELEVAKLFDPIEHSFYKNKTHQPTIEQVMESYNIYKNEAWGTTIKYTITIPLLNFSTELENVEIGQFKLSKFTIEEKEYLWNRECNMLDGFGVTASAFALSNFKLTATYTRSRSDSVSTGHFTEEARELITALRLIKKGDVSGLAMIERINLRYAFCHLASASLLDNYLPKCDRFNGNIFELKESDVKQWNDLFTSYKNNRKNKLHGLEVAIRRFNQSYSRESKEDVVIDLTVVIESCLLHNDQELSFKFSIRGAALLAKVINPKESKAILDAIYFTRSAIVHRGENLAHLQKDKECKKKLKKISETTTTNQLPQLLQNIVREALKVLIKRMIAGENTQTIIQALDNQLIEAIFKDYPREPNLTESIEVQ